MQPWTAILHCNPIIYHSLSISQEVLPQSPLVTISLSDSPYLLSWNLLVWTLGQHQVSHPLGSHPEYFVFMRSVFFQPDCSVQLEVYLQLSFSQSGGALIIYNNLSNAAHAMLILLPPFSSRHSTPESFGAPITIGRWSNSQDA